MRRRRQPKVQPGICAYFRTRSHALPLLPGIDQSLHALVFFSEVQSRFEWAIFTSVNALPQAPLLLSPQQISNTVTLLSDPSFIMRMRDFVHISSIPWPHAADLPRAEEGTVGRTVRHGPEARRTHHTSQRSVGFMGVPSSHAKAVAKAGKLTKGPAARNSPGACESPSIRRFTEASVDR